MMPEPQMPVTPVSFVASAKPGSVDQRSQPIRADDLEARLLRFGVDLDPFDGAGGGALAGADLRALEGRAGGRGAGEHALGVAQQDLGIGADIDDSVSSVWRAGRLGQRDGGGVGADMARDAGQQVDPRAVGATPARSRSRASSVTAVGGGQREGRLAQFHRVDAQQEVVHHRVADDDQSKTRRGVDPGLLRQPLWIRSPMAARTASSSPRAAGVHHGVAHPAHQVLAEADLRVGILRDVDDQVAEDPGRAGQPAAGLRSRFSA
jgi:hypothetical protein